MELVSPPNREKLLKARSNKTEHQCCFSFTPGFSPVMDEVGNQNRFNGFPSPRTKPLKRFFIPNAHFTGLKPGVNENGPPALESRAASAVEGTVKCLPGTELCYSFKTENAIHYPPIPNCIGRESGIVHRLRPAWNHGALCHGALFRCSTAALF